MTRVGFRALGTPLVHSLGPQAIRVLEASGEEAGDREKELRRWLLAAFRGAGWAS